jgi:hypothetical protein
MMYRDIDGDVDTYHGHSRDMKTDMNQTTDMDVNMDTYMFMDMGMESNNLNGHNPTFIALIALGFKK